MATIAKRTTGKLNVSKKPSLRAALDKTIGKFGPTSAPAGETTPPRDETIGMFGAGPIPHWLCECRARNSEELNECRVCERPRRYAEVDAAGNHLNESPAVKWTCKCGAKNESEWDDCWKCETARVLGEVLPAETGAKVKMPVDSPPVLPTTLAPKAKGKKADVASAVQPDGAPDVEVRMIAIELIAVSNCNPRKTFDKAEQDELTSSIKQYGVLQALLVATQFAGSYELIAGERRLRSAKAAGLKEVPCQVRKMSATDIFMARLEENFKRAELNAIEEALAFQEATTTGGLTQEELAKRLTLTPGHISNRIRLLELPDAWRKRIISAEIPLGRARDLIPLAKSPAILERLAEDIRAEDEVSLDEWNETVYDIVHAHARTMQANEWDERSRKFEPTPEQKAELQVVEIPGRYHGKATFALNVALWDQLQKEAVEKAAEKRAKQEARAAKANGKPGASTAQGSAQTSAAEEAAKKKKLAAQFGKRLYIWKVRWLQQEIYERIAIAPENLVLKCLLYFAVSGQQCDRDNGLAASIKSAGGSRKGESYRLKRWETLSTVKLEGLPAIARSAVQRWTQHDFTGFNSDLQPGDVEALAFEIGVDVKRDWKLTRDFLELHTKAQLLALAQEWKTEINDNLKFREIVDRLETIKHAACPKELLTVKACAVH